MSLKKEILKGTAILTIAGFATRLLGLYNRVFLANIIGPVQLGIYQLIFPVFMVCISICCSGIETALSRLVAANAGKGCWGNIRRLVRLAVSLAMGISVLLALLVYIFAEPISTFLIKEPACAPSLRIMAPVIVFTTAHSCILGYFYGMKRTVIPATSQLVEQVIRVGAIYFLFIFLFNGKDADATLAVMGMLAGDAAACIFTLLSYKLHVKLLKREETENIRCQKTETRRRLAGQLLDTAIPLTANRLALTMLQSVEAILIPSMLRLYYMSADKSLEIFGVVNGMAFPFIMFPTTLTNSLATMLLPTVAEAGEKGDYGLIRRAISRSLHYCLLIGIVSMVIFYLYGNAFGMVIFKNELAGQLLTSFAFLCPFMYITTSLGSVLNGLGKTRITLMHNVISLGIRVIFIVTCIPRFGIQGYLWGMLASYLSLAALHFIRIGKICGINFKVWRSIILPGILAALSGMLSLAVYQYMINYMSIMPLLLLAISCIILCGIYGMSLVITGLLKSDGK